MVRRSKPLRPSLRERKRYLRFCVLSGSVFCKDELRSAAAAAIMHFIGVLGVSCAGLRFIKDGWRSNQGILQVNHLYVDHVRASLAAMNTIGDSKVICSVEKVSGTLKSLL